MTVALAEMLGLATALPLLGTLFAGGTTGDMGYLGKVSAHLGITEFSPTGLLLLLGALFILRELSQNLCTLSVNWARAVVEARFRVDYTQKILQIGYRSLQRLSAGSAINVMTSQIDSTGVGVRLLGNLISSAVIGGFFVLSTIFLEPVFLALLAPFIILSVIIAFYSSKLTRKYARANIFIRDRIITAISEVLRHFKFVKSSALEELYESELRGGIFGYLANVRRNLTVQFISITVPQTITLILVFGSLLYYLGLPNVDAQSVLLVVLLLHRASSRIINVQTDWRSLAQNIAAFERFEESRLGLITARERVGSGDDLPAALQAIRFNGVSYSYDTENSALNRLDLELGMTGMVGVVGPSGAGKTTFVDMLTGIIQPDEGGVELGNKALSSFKIRDWRRSIAYIPQDCLLVKGTIRDNLLLGAPQDIADDKFASICASCLVDEFVSRFPNGYDTEVQDIGTSVSGGQRQRILIARALLSEKPVIVLDEAMSALDTQTEAVLYKTLRQTAATRLILIVAHRLEPLKYADRIVVFQDGTAAEDGTFDELVARDGLFTRMISEWDAEFVANGQSA